MIYLVIEHLHAGPKLVAVDDYAIRKDSLVLYSNGAGRKIPLSLILSIKELEVTSERAVFP